MRPKKETEAVGAHYRLVGIKERQGMKKHIPYTLYLSKYLAASNMANKDRERVRGNPGPKGGKLLLS